MPVYGKPNNSFMAPVQPTVQSASYPAPVGGVNALDSIMNMPQTDCLTTFNLMPVEYGMRLRQGYREWAVNVGPTGDDNVRSMVGFDGQTTDAADDRLWAVTENGIYDVSLFNTTAPVQDVAFTQQGPAAGFGVSTEFTSLADDHYLFYADGLNGLHQYAGETQTWSIPPSGTGDTDWYYLDPADGTTRIAFPVENVAFVMVHKLRIWVILEDDTNAYYLPIASISGELTVFSFGAQMINGGNLQGLWSWTLDGGDGIDDVLVAVSRGGDLMVYGGSDPIAQDWALKGTWYLGQTPRSRRLAAQHGPEMYILSSFGLTSVRDLLSGSAANIERTSASAKVSRFIRTDIKSGPDFYEWSVETHPPDGFMQIVTPPPANTNYVQYNQNLQTKAWGFWQDVPVTSATSWNAEYMIGSTDGKVYIYDGVLDNSQLPQPNTWTDTITNVPGAEWTDNLDGSYTCDGTQAGETEVVFATNTPPEGNTRYSLRYTITGFGGGLHSIKYAGLTSTPQAGDGAFSVDLVTPSTPGADEITIVGDANFVGTFELIYVGKTADIGTPIGFSTLTAFQSLNGNHATFKIPGFIRTIGVLAGTISLNVEAVFDYSIETVVDAPPEVSTEDVSLWDSALWDVAVWDFESQGQSYPFGSLGIGRVMAIGMAGSASSRINIVGWDLMYTEGGYL